MDASFFIVKQSKIDFSSKNLEKIFTIIDNKDFGSSKESAIDKIVHDDDCEDR